MNECLVFIKPDAFLRKGIGATILQDFLNNEDFSIIAFKEVQVSDDLAKIHYQEHEGKHFFPWLVKAIRASPVLVMIIQGEIQKIREFLGATFVQKANPQTIRGKYGIWGGINSVHASDSSESGLRELDLWRNKADLQKDYEAPKKIQKYIKKWVNYSKTNNTIKLRELCKKLADKKITKEQLFEQLEVLLKEDCPFTDSKTLENFANIVIENILL